MDHGRFEVFGRDAATTALRWFDRAAPMRDRVLDIDAVATLIDRVNAGYRVTNPDLPSIGGDLYRWLDGPTERWLATVRERARPLALGVDCEAGLRHLPWELMHDGKDFVTTSASNPLVPVRISSSRTGDAAPAANRPLRILFMASSPTNVTPVLDFEREEAVILDAARNNLELTVEESGSLPGLRDLFTYYGEGHFDVFHLSGHALVTQAGPRFVLEDDEAGRCDVSADELAEAIGHRWPRLIFLSGCHTGRAGADGELTSMAEALVAAGAPAVLGWALPVGDHDATTLARSLYDELANGFDAATATATARRDLFASGSPYWHLLRLFADRQPLVPLVTPRATKDRERISYRSASTLFLDADRKVRVASGEGFVGRRRELQACLRALRADGHDDEPSVVLVHGMGGLGKSTLAARILDRMRPTHPQSAVWVGAVDEVEVQKLTEKVRLDPSQHLKVNELLAIPGVPLRDRLRFVFDGPMAGAAVMFVFDDFEQNLEADGNGGYRCTPAGLETVTAIAGAIIRTANASRVLLTSRYDFPLPADVAVHRLSLGALRDNDLTKKLRHTRSLHEGSRLDRVVRQQAVHASAGIPRLIEWIDAVVTDAETDYEALLERVGACAAEFRESVMAQSLLESQSSATRRVLAHAAIFELPVPAEAIAALLPHDDITDGLQRSVAVGLVEAGRDPQRNEQRYFVSPVVRPMLTEVDEALGAAERHTAHARGARFLYERWVDDG